VNNGGDILLCYVFDSATIHNNGKTNGSLFDAKMLFSTEGILLGFDELDGVIPSDTPSEKSFGEYVTFRLVADQADFEVETYFRNTLNDEWSESVAVIPGDSIWCLIEYRNTGTIQQDNVVLKSYFPASIQYVSNSSHLRNAHYPNQASLVDGNFYEGINVVSYAPGSSVLFGLKLK